MMTFRARGGGSNIRFYQVLAVVRCPLWSIVVYLAAVSERVENLSKLDIFSPLGLRSIPLIGRFNYPNGAGVTSWMVGDLMDGTPMQSENPHAIPATPRARGDPMSVR